MNPLKKVLKESPPIFTRMGDKPIWTYKGIENARQEVETHFPACYVYYSVNEGGSVPFLEIGFILQDEAFVFSRVPWNDCDTPCPTVYQSVVSWRNQDYRWVNVSEWKKNDVTFLERYGMDRCWFVTVNEIRQGESCGFRMAPEVVSFFQENPDCLVLEQAETRERYIPPQIGYLVCLQSRLVFMSVFGPNPHWFYDYPTAMEAAQYITQSEPWGLVKFALLGPVIDHGIRYEKDVPLERWEVAHYNQLVGLCYHLLDTRTSVIGIR